ncbi:hypothetical protein KP509_32G048400 [Ceratopteris richardii]|nr:hypothetical protein KP509_32G048400 [Ceratopteris richardii]
MSKNGFDAHPLLGNNLVSALAEAGLIDNAQQVFDNLSVRNEWSWYCLINGFVKCTKPHLAFNLYELMQDERGVNPAGHTFVALLKACIQLKDLGRGLELHSHIVRMGILEKDVFVSSALIHMYAKCGSLLMAQNTLDSLRTRNVVPWNTLMTAYSNNQEYAAVHSCFEQMRHEHVIPDPVSFVCILKACSNTQSIQKIQEIHAQIEKIGVLEVDIYVNNTLVDAYANCGLLLKAEQVFEKILVHSVVSWNTIMSAYAKNGQHEEVIKCFEQMQLEGNFPDDVSFACALGACGSIKAVEKEQTIYSGIIEKTQLAGEPDIGIALIHLFIKADLLGNAQTALDKLSLQDVSVWNTIIRKHVEHQCNEDALDCFRHMQRNGTVPNAITFIYSLKACSGLGDQSKGQEIHSEVERKGLLEKDIAIASSLVDMYANCGLLPWAQEVFDKLSVKDVVLWNILILRYAEHGYGEEALKCFRSMQVDSICPDSITFLGALEACGCLAELEKLYEIHTEIERLGFIQEDDILATALVDAYVKCGLLSKAQEIFDELPAKNIVTWNALIGGYAEAGCKDLVIEYLEHMQLEGFTPDVFTFVTMMKSRLEGMALELHSETARMGFLEKDLVAGNALVGMYIRCGFLTRAQEVFVSLPLKDVISWNVLLSGYLEKGYGEETLRILEQMQLQGVSPNRISLICGLKACACTGSIEKGKEIHAELFKKDFLDRDLVGNALISMYAKCGQLAMAQDVFDNLQMQDIVSCNSLIAGYSQIGDAEVVFHIFNRMQREGITPNSVTFVVVLSACSCIGLYGKSKMYYEAMVNDYGILPTLQHNACIIDLLGRIGKLDLVNMLLRKLPSHPNIIVLRSVLGASRCWGHINFGKHTFDCARYLNGNML